MSNPTPPPVDSGVFSASSSATINAPVDKVWKVLLDFPSYPEWNSFVRSEVVVDQANKPLDDQTPKEGSLLLLTVHLPPSMDDTVSSQKAKELVTHVDHESYRVAWRYVSLPKWLLSAERWQYLTKIDDNQTKYETNEVFGGPVAYLVKWFTGKNLQQGFETFANELKNRSEQV